MPRRDTYGGQVLRSATSNEKTTGDHEGLVLGIVALTGDEEVAHSDFAGRVVGAVIVVQDGKTENAG